MTATVTIEGSITPSAELARGERRTVQLTESVQRLIDGGFVVVVESDAPAPVTPAVVDPAGADPQTVSPPARNASREDWAEFLALAGFVTEGRGRDELIDMWDAHQDADALGEDFDTYAAAQGAPDEE